MRAPLYGLPRPFPPGWRRSLTTIGCVAAGLYLHIALHRWSEGRLLFDALLPAIIVVAAFAGPRHGLLATAALVVGSLPAVLTGGMIGIPVPRPGPLALSLGLSVLGGLLVCAVTHRLQSSRREADVARLAAESRDAELRSVCASHHETVHALQLKESELKLVTDAMPALVCYVTRDRRHGFANQAYARWFDTSADALRERPLSDVLDPEIMAQIDLRLDQAFDGHTVRFDCAVHSTSGPARWVDITYTPHLDEHGHVLGCIALVQDITQRKHFEQERDDAHARYHFLASAMPQIVWTAGPDGTYDYFNEKWTEFTGRSAEESLAEACWTECLHPDDLTSTLNTWKAALLDHHPYEFQHRLRAAHGTYRWFLSRALPRRDESGNIVQWVGCTTDIDDQRRAYAELAAAREHLRRHAEELETSVDQRTRSLHDLNTELEAFTYATSHALRAPAQFIVGYANAISGDADSTLTKESADYLQRIHRIAERMERMIHELLAYSRISRAEIKLTDLSLNVVIGDVLTYHQSEIQQSRAMIVVDSPLALVHADATGLFQVFSNLITNAIKFTRPGSTPVVQLRAEHLGDRVRIWVEDEGIGIKPAHQERIFNLFERLHTTNEYPGTGIGLSLVRKAVARMGGACGVESAPGEGCRFWVDLQPAHHAVAISHPARRENPVGA